MPDVVLTGLMRSGSTLTCHLLNRCADTVALHEPIRIRHLIEAHGLAALPGQIDEFFAATRRSLLVERNAASKLVAGRVPDNTFDAVPPENETLRRNLASHGQASFAGKELSPDFLLAIKHNTSFAALLDRLVTRYPCYAMVRHPLAVLASWNSVQIPVQQGFVPVGEAIDPALQRALGKIGDVTERQFYILDWFFERFLRLLPRTSILRYEDLVSSGGRNLSVVAPDAAALDEPLISKNATYDSARMLALGEKLLGRDGAWRELYPRASIEEMLVPLRTALAT